MSAKLQVFHLVDRICASGTLTDFAIDSSPISKESTVAEDSD